MNKAVFDQQHQAFLKGIQSLEENALCLSPPENFITLPSDDDEETLMHHWQNFIEGDSTLDLIQDLGEIEKETPMFKPHYQSHQTPLDNDLIQPQIISSKLTKPSQEMLYNLNKLNSQTKENAKKFILNLNQNKFKQLTQSKSNNSQNTNNNLKVKIMIKKSMLNFIKQLNESKQYNESSDLLKKQFESTSTNEETKDKIRSQSVESQINSKSKIIKLKVKKSKLRNDQQLIPSEQVNIKQQFASENSKDITFRIENSQKNGESYSANNLFMDSKHLLQTSQQQFNAVQSPTYTKISGENQSQSQNSRQFQSTDKEPLPSQSSVSKRLQQHKALNLQKRSHTSNTFYQKQIQSKAMANMIREIADEHQPIIDEMKEQICVEQLSEHSIASPNYKAPSNCTFNIRKHFSFNSPHRINDAKLNLKKVKITPQNLQQSFQQALIGKEYPSSTSSSIDSRCQSQQSYSNDYNKCLITELHVEQSQQTFDNRSSIKRDLKSMSYMKRQQQFNATHHNSSSNNTIPTYTQITQ